MHNEGKSYQCNLCNKYYSLKNSLEKHIKVHHGENNTYLCIHCDKTFSYRHNLIHHMEIHFKEKLYQCNYCDKNFKYQGHLTVHLKTHNVDRLFICNYCGKTFSNNKSRSYHMKLIHTEERLNQCNQCKRFFFVWNNLKDNMEMRKEDSPFQCNQCDKTRIIHTKTYPFKTQYQCRECDQSFSQKISLISHERAHISGLAHKCSHCERLFSYKVNLISHTRIGLCKGTHKNGDANIPVKYINSDIHVSQNLKDKAVKNIIKLSNNSVNIYSFENDKSKIGKTHSATISSGIDNMKREEEIGDRNCESDLMSELKVEIKEEPMVYQSIDNDECIEPKVEIKDENMDDINYKEDHFGESKQSADI